MLALITLNERAGFQFHRAEIADGGQVEFHKIAGYIRLSQKLPECGIVKCGCSAFLLHQPGSEKRPGYVISARKKLIAETRRPMSA